MILLYASYGCFLRLNPSTPAERAPPVHKATGDYGLKKQPYGVLTNEFYRLLDKRMHISIILNERHHLAIARKNLLYSP